jgi:hypothetical protein
MPFGAGGQGQDRRARIIDPAQRGLEQQLLQPGPWRRPGRLDRGFGRAIMELQGAMEPPRHAQGFAVVHETDHVEPRDQAVAGCEHEAAQQRRRNAAVLKRPLNRDGELRRTGDRRFGSARADRAPAPCHQ